MIFRHELSETNNQQIISFIITLILYPYGKVHIKSNISELDVFQFQMKVDLVMMD